MYPLFIHFSNLLYIIAGSAVGPVALVNICLWKDRHEGLVTVGDEALLMINHDRVTTVEGDATRGTTTLVYLQLHISLYTGTVHVLYRVAGIHPLV